MDPKQMTEAEQAELVKHLQKCPGKAPPAELVRRQFDRAVDTLRGKQIGLLFQFVVYAFNCPHTEKIQHFHADAMDLLADNLTPEQIGSVIAGLEQTLVALKAKQS